MCGYVVTSASSFGRNERNTLAAVAAASGAPAGSSSSDSVWDSSDSAHVASAPEGAPVRRSSALRFFALPRARRQLARCHHSSSTVAFVRPEASRFRRAAAVVASVMLTRFAPSRAATRPASPRPAPTSTTTVSGVIAPRDAACAGSSRRGSSDARTAAVASHRKSPSEYAQGQMTVEVPGTNAAESEPSWRRRTGLASPPSAGCAYRSSLERWSTP